MDKCVEFTMYYRCNVDCVFCSHTRRMARFGDAPVPMAEIVETLKEKRAQGFNHVTFTGGEPTLYPKFWKLLEICRLMGYRTRAVSNGWALASEDYAKKTLPHLDELCLSIHGATEASHDRLTGASGGYLKMKAALETVSRLKPGLRLIVNTVALNGNLDELAPIAAWVKSYAPVRELWISTLVAQGAGKDRFDELAVPNRSVIARAREIQAAADRVTVRYYGFPLCVLGEHRERATDYGRNPAVAIFRGLDEAGAPVLREMESKKTDPPKVMPAACSSCSVAGFCGGLWREYHQKYGDAELSPISPEVAA